MEYHLDQKTISQLSLAADTVKEQAVDADISLPDYCPDIERILSCTLIPEVNLANVSGDRLNVEGLSVVRVLYLDGDEGRIRSYEYQAPFSDNIAVKGTPENPSVYLDIKPEYLNCRALSPRKLSVHGAFSLGVKIAVAEEQPYCAYDGGELQTKCEKMTVSSLCGMCCETFSMQEDIPVGGKNEIASLLSHRLSARITEVKAIHNKIMLSAELKLELMYLSGLEKPEVECMSYSVPISRVIDCEGVDENAVIDSDLIVMSDDVRLQGDALDGSALISLDAKLCFNAECYKEQEIEVLKDAFSTETQAQVKKDAFSCSSDTVCRSFTEVGKADVSLDDEIGRVLDVHCEKLGVTHTLRDDAILLHAKMTVGILYENTENELRYVERDAEFGFSPDTGECTDILRLRAAVESLSYRLADSRKLELRAQICCRMTLCRRQTGEAVTAVSADDDAPEREPDGTLILYYSDGGEEVWDIAKRFCSRPADIIAENELEGDRTQCGMMLLIPTA